MQQIVTVKFKYRDKPTKCNPLKLNLNPGHYVICKTKNGLEYGEVVKGKEKTKETSLEAVVVRLATQNDRSILKQREKDEHDAFIIAKQSVAKYNFNMKLISVYKTFDGNKIIFYFSSETRIDFRELVKDLAYSLHKKIELHQVGVRDETRILGGLGMCGQRLCCSRFLSQFNPVSMRMAKEQGISLSPSKLSGCCSRLMCCLKYEQQAYKELLKNCPPIGSNVKTKDGTGIIIDGNPLTGIYRVQLDDNPDAAFKHYHKDEIELSFLNHKEEKSNATNQQDNNPNQTNT